MCYDYKLISYIILFFLLLCVSFLATGYCVCIFVNVWNADILKINFFFFIHRFQFILNHGAESFFVFCYSNDFDQFDFPTFQFIFISHLTSFRHSTSLIRVLYMINTTHMFDISVLFLFLFSYLSLSIFAEFLIVAALRPVYLNGWISWRSDQWYLIIFVVLVGFFFVHSTLLFWLKYNG